MYDLAQDRLRFQAAIDFFLVSGVLSVPHDSFFPGNLKTTQFITTQILFLGSLMLIIQFEILTLTLTHHENDNTTLFLNDLLHLNSSPVTLQ